MPDVNKGIINYGSIGGDAKVSSVAKHVGDNVTVRASGSNVNVKSHLEHSAQTLAGESSGERAQREKLDELFRQLQAVLSQIPNTHRDGADAVARQAQVLADATKAPSPSKTFIQVSGEALKSAAKFVTGVAPSLPGIITAIVSAAGAL